MPSEPPVTPAEAYEDAALEAAFTNLLLQEAEELMASEPTEEEALLLAQLEERLPQQMARLDKSLRKQERRQHFSKCTLNFLQTAAAILAVVFVGLSTAIAANAPFRTSFVNFLTEATPEFITMNFIKSNASPAIPEGWLAEYYPTYLPEGYVLVGMSSGAHYSKAVYELDGDMLLFSASASPSTAQINARNAEIRKLQLHNIDATLVTIGHEHTVIWSEDNMYYSVTASSPGMAIDVAHSIAPVPD